jgi:hypothetical protein
MSRLDRDHDVVALARELDLRGNSIEAIIRFCEEKIGRWISEFGTVADISALEGLVANRLGLVFEEVYSDDDLERIIRKYVGLGEYVFATLHNELGPETFGLTIKRKNRGKCKNELYVAVIDCREEKAARRFFTRWHEIAHLLVLEKELDTPVRRASHDPIEQLMDEIAGRIGFYDPIFDPIFALECTKPPLRFDMIETIRSRYSDTASFQATLFACQRRMKTPVVYIEAEMKYKVGEERRLRSKQRSFFSVDPPVAKLRISMAVPNRAATNENFHIVKNMRVPECSVIHRLHVAPAVEEASGQEDLGSWEFSDGGSLPDCEVWVDARKLENKVIAIVQPLN